jgi:hypothetical protein
MMMHEKRGAAQNYVGENAGEATTKVSLKGFGLGWVEFFGFFRPFDKLRGRMTAKTTARAASAGRGSW